MPSRRPPFGRMVHYVTHRAEVVTGIVTKVDPGIDNRVNLHLFRDGPAQEHIPPFVENVDYAPVDPVGALIENTWHWPARD